MAGDSLAIAAAAVVLIGAVAVLTVLAAHYIRRGRL
jgi:hypothetical protein